MDTEIEILLIVSLFANLIAAMAYCVRHITSSDCWGTHIIIKRTPPESPVHNTDIPSETTPIFKQEV